MLTAVREVYGEPGTVALRDVDRPTVGDHEVLVEVLGGRTRSGVWHLVTGLPHQSDLRSMGCGNLTRS